MKVEIKVPQLGESVTEAVVASLLKESGAQVAMDEEILELETDKVNQVLAAPKGGRLELTVSVDDTVTVGQVIGTVDTEAAGEVQEASTPAPEAPKPEAPPQEPVQVQEPHTGPGTRYTPDQYVADLSKKEEAPAAAPPPQKRERGETRKKMSKIRQVIARRLVEAQHTTAMLTTFNEIDMSAVMDIRARYKESFEKQHGIKLGFMSFFVKGCVAALNAVPGINSYIDGNEIVHREYFDVGVAVGTDRGLMVPVLRGCDELSFAQVEQQIREYAAAARAGKISVDDLQGGGFTITNGGIYGSLLSTPILNPPQSGILGMHKIQQRPVVVDGEMVPRPMMYTALSYDHRIVDGAEAVTFLVKLKQYLEDPATLMLEL